MLVVLLTAGDLPRMRRPVRRIQRPVLAECRDSARQAASKDTHPLLERAGPAFGSTRAPDRSGMIHSPPVRSPERRLISGP
jgi:hypothetical protein